MGASLGIEAKYGCQIFSLTNIEWCLFLWCEVLLELAKTWICIITAIDLRMVY